MPLYEFYCPECSREFELLLSHTQADRATCPECEHTPMERKLSLFAAKTHKAPSTTPSPGPSPQPAAFTDHCAHAWKQNTPTPSK